MIDSAEALFKAAPRKEGYFLVGEDQVKVIEISLPDRLELVEFVKEFPKDIQLIHAFILSKTCPLLSKKTPADIKDRLAPASLCAGALEAMAISGMLDEKKLLAESEDSSTD